MSLRQPGPMGFRRGRGRRFFVPGAYVVFGGDKEPVNPFVQTPSPVPFNLPVPQITLPDRVIVHTDSVELNETATAEFLRNSGTVDFGITNSWSVALWFKQQTAPATFDTLYELASSGSEANEVVMFWAGSAFPLRVELYNSGGTVFKRYQWNSFTTIDPDVWVHVLISWDGTNLRLFKNGTEVTPNNTFVDDAGTMTNTNRQMTVGADESSGGHNDMRVHSMAFWSSAITTNAEATKIASTSQLDLSVDQGDYQSSAGLVHWWRFGENTANIGQDFVGTIDMDAAAQNVDSADIVADAPA